MSTSTCIQNIVINNNNLKESHITRRYPFEFHVLTFTMTDDDLTASCLLSKFDTHIRHDS